MVLFSEGHTQPALKHSSEQRRVIVQLSFFAWRGVKGQASPTGRHKTEVSLASLAGVERGRELSLVAVVDCLRKLFLRQLSEHVQGQLTVVIDHAVVTVESQTLGRRLRTQSGLKRATRVEVLAQAMAAAARGETRANSRLFAVGGPIEPAGAHSKQL